MTVVEAGSALGGLAAGFEARGVAFDGGPYVLLDRPGLDWAFHQLGLDGDHALALRRIEALYEVGFRDEEPVLIHADCDRTADEVDARWPGVGARYRGFVAEMSRVHTRLLPLLFKSPPRPWDALSSLPFLLRSLRSVLARARLPAALVRTLAIWTHVAGQTAENAPAPMALVPALVHTHGAWYPRGGLRAIPDTLATACDDAGVAFRTRAPVVAIRCARGAAVGVELEDGDHVAASAVVSNFNGVGTYLELVGDVPARARARLAALPLQSPGVGAWLTVKRTAAPPYLRFRLPAEREGCRLLVATGEADPACERDGWSPARIVAPMDHATAERLGETGQREFLDRVLAETWWGAGIAEHEIVATRIPVEWGRRHHLHRDSMNPVMTARFMRSGRIAHRSPYVRGLYLAGSSTHPGQWVSFCAISGIHAADALHGDLG